MISASGLMFKSDFPTETPHLEAILEDCPDILARYYTIECKQTSPKYTQTY